MTDRLAAALAELAEAIRAEVRAEADSLAEGPDRLLTIAEACHALGGIGRSALYGELQAGRLRSCKVGRRRLVPSSAIADYITERR
jgi:excisionase family DNA binding protein